MAEFSSHVPGTFSWVELATTDQKAGVAFYRALFGWDVNEQPIGPTETYSMFLMRGKEVAAAYTMRPEERQSGAPPHWNLYVTVANVDEAVKRAEGLGAKVLAPPFDVMDAGRMAVLQDPTGAVFQRLGAEEAHRREDPQRAGRALLERAHDARHERGRVVLYRALWLDAEAQRAGRRMEYTEFSNQGQPSVGMMPMPAHMPAGVPSYWMPYFQVADCDASAAKAKELGASVMVPPQDIPKTGRFAILKDPQGAMFAVFKFAGE